MTQLNESSGQAATPAFCRKAYRQECSRDDCCSFDENHSKAL